MAAVEYGNIYPAAVAAVGAASDGDGDDVVFLSWLIPTDDPERLAKIFCDVEVRSSCCSPMILPSLLAQTNATSR